MSKERGIASDENAYQNLGKSLEISRPLSLIFFLSFLFAFLIFTSPALSAESKQIKKILILHSDAPEMSYIKLLHKSVFDYFDLNKSIDVEFMIEYMDWGHYKSDEYETKLKELYRLKYSANRPDLIIAVSYQATKFITGQGRELFAGVPVVFTALGKQELDKIAIDSDLVTGVYTDIDFDKAIETILRLQPGLKRIAVITGSSPYDMIWRKKISSAFSAYSKEVEVDYLYDFSMDDLKNKISQYRDGTAIYYFMMFEDGAGNKYEPWKALSIFAPESGVPIFTSFDSLMGYGTVGGYQISIELWGKLTAEIGQRILEGEVPSDIPIMKYNDWPYIFDWRELEKWGIDEGSLPQGSIVRYKPPTAWDLYRWQILSGMSFIALLLLIIIILFHNIRYRRHVEKELLRISKAVESTSDAIGLSDPRGNHFYNNRAFTELFGYTAKELDAAGGPPVVYADKSVAKVVFDNIMSGRSWNGEIEMVSKSGRKFPASVRADAIKDEAQNIIGLIGIVTDITESKKISKDLLESKKDLQKLAGRLIMNQENEFRRLARELHDDLTQQLAVMSIDAGNIIQQFKDLPPAVFSTVSYIKDRLIKVSKDVHRMSRALHPSILDDLGLVRAVKSECSNFSSRMGIAVVFTPKNIPDTVPNNIALTVYRIIQEGLANIAKHANTKNAYVFLESNDNSILLTVRDTGKGFDPVQVRHYAALGLGSMRERVRLVNGEFSITSRPGKGTSIEVEIPLTTNDEQSNDEVRTEKQRTKTFSVCLIAVRLYFVIRLFDCSSFVLRSYMIQCKQHRLNKG